MFRNINSNIQSVASISRKPKAVELQFTTNIASYFSYFHVTTVCT